MSYEQKSVKELVEWIGKMSCEEKGTVSGKKDPVSKLIEKYNSGAFHFVETYEELVKVNVAYLQGKIKWAPYAFGRDKKEIPFKTIKSSKLIKVNELGFLTTTSQPSLCTYGKTRKNTVYDVERKSYVKGWLQKHHKDALVKFLHEKQLHFYMCDTDGVMAYNLPPSTFNLTRQREHEDIAGLELEKWKKTLDVDMNKLVDEFDHALHMFHENQCLDDCMLVMIADKTYGSGAVEDVLIEYLKKH